MMLHTSCLLESWLFLYHVNNGHSSLFFSPPFLFCSDGETFISADDLRINLWNLEIGDQIFNIIDVKPTNMEDLTGKTYSGLNSIIMFK